MIFYLISFYIMTFCLMTFYLMTFYLMTFYLMTFYLMTFYLILFYQLNLKKLDWTLSGSGGSAFWAGASNFHVELPPTFIFEGRLKESGSAHRFRLYETNGEGYLRVPHTVFGNFMRFLGPGRVNWGPIVKIRVSKLAQQKFAYKQKKNFWLPQIFRVLDLLILDPGGSQGPIHLNWPPQIHFRPHKAPTILYLKYASFYFFFFFFF